MTPKLELRFVYQKYKVAVNSVGDCETKKKVLQFRYVYSDAVTTEWQTVPFDESVVLEPEEG